MKAILIACVACLLLLAGASVGRTANFSAGGTFTDDDGNVHEGNIEAIAAVGITKGCNPPANTLFCPTDSVTRGQMAAFLVRALGLAPDTSDTFTDDDASVFEADIQALAAAGITKGCDASDSTRYCPGELVTRGQMAAFLVRAFGYDDSGAGNLFEDDDGSTFEVDIDKLGTAGVTRGCNPPANTMYCPNDHVRRDQMASFLARALGLDAIVPSSITSILYVHGAVEAADLATVNPDGTGVTFLPPVGGLAGCPERSPDGSLIAFQRLILSGAVIERREVVVSDADGNNIQVLVEAGCPTWSPDGTQLAVPGLNGDPGIWLIDGTGGVIDKVNDSAGSPDWSPNGDLLVVVGEGWIYTEPSPSSSAMGADIVFGGANPEWSPDGSQIAYDKEVGGIRQVFIINADGSQELQITSGGTLNGGVNPDWSPDGTEIVFGSDRDGGWDLYVIGVDTTGLRRLTITAEDEYPSSPDW